ncbi:carboxypeptidase-like regulatory domain-containing protein [Micromonospora sp. NPDC049559]|uniref:carboxypeptidase-like regulatory domain-containing protein n=1 Tax=Micromonospora sp. NPDC049559 TaxID=3155923 RepID=UPI0034187DA4
MNFLLARRAVLAGATLAAVVLSGAPPAIAAGTGSIGGRITTSGGAPATAVVTAYTWDGWESAGSASTDPSGNYRIDGLATGSYLVEIKNSGGPAQYYHRKTRIGEAESISVVGGASTTVDEQLLPTGVITGTLRDKGGQPMPYVPVKARPDDGDWQSGSTDAEGRYRLEVFPGRHMVSFQPFWGATQEQYVPGKLDQASAGHFDVAAGGEVNVDDQALPTGSLSGSFTDLAGRPVANASVELSTAGGESSWWDLSTDGNGAFNVPALLVGSYRIGFYRDGRYQYYKGKVTPEAADPVEVRADEQTRISDAWLPTGSLRVVAVDAVTGAAVPNFCADIRCSNGTGSITFGDLAQGSRPEYLVYTSDGSYLSAFAPVAEIKADQTVEVVVRLQRAARIATTVVDRATGKPVPNVCVVPLALSGPHLPDGYGDCTDSTGKLTIGALTAGSYNLFADPGEGSPYGRQWVGPAGGTGDQRAAVTVVAKAGATVTAPQVLLDKAGTVSGQVTDEATGAPVPNAIVSLLTNHPGSDGGVRFSADVNGRYRATGLGPYEWPLLFGAPGFASEWSGGAASRYLATPTKVTAGATATRDASLVRGVTVSGTIKDQDGALFESGWVTAHNPDTGDYIGGGWMQDGRYAFPVLPNQSIYLSYSVRQGTHQYDGVYSRQAPPRRDGRATPLAGQAIVPAPGSATRPLTASRVAVATADPAVSAGSVPRRPTPPTPGVYVVPATGTLTIDMVVTSG